MTYVVSYEVEGSYEDVAAAVYKSFYLAEIDAKSLTIRERVASPGETVFNFPATQKLIKHLNENPSIVGNAQGEGDWLLSDDGKVGED